MRYLVTALGVALVAGCAKPEAPPAEPPAPPAAAALNPADLAGTWSVKNMAEDKDSVIVAYSITATGTTEGWTITLPGRQPQPMTVTISGDSVMSSVGPYESVLRKGVQVTANSVMRLSGGMLMGTTVAHYAGAGADSVLRMRVEGTKNP